MAAGSHAVPLGCSWQQEDQEKALSFCNGLGTTQMKSIRALSVGTSCHSRSLAPGWRHGARAGAHPLS